MAEFQRANMKHIISIKPTVAQRSNRNDGPIDCGWYRVERGENSGTKAIHSAKKCSIGIVLVHGEFTGFQLELNTRNDDNHHKYDGEKNHQSVY